MDREMSIKTTESEQRRKKTEKKWIFTDLWDKIKWSDICISESWNEGETK